jgi:hypothetical protein
VTHLPTTPDQTAVLVAHAARWHQVQAMSERPDKPAIVEAVERWNRAYLNPDLPHRATISTLNNTEKRRLETAAQTALRLYPGPIGELLRRELSAAATLGHTIGRADALLLRLADHLLATSDDLITSRSAAANTEAMPCAVPSCVPGSQAGRA